MKYCSYALFFAVVISSCQEKGADIEIVVKDPQEQQDPENKEEKTGNTTGSKTPEGNTTVDNSNGVEEQRQSACTAPQFPNWSLSQKEVVCSADALIKAVEEGGHIELKCSEGAVIKLTQTLNINKDTIITSQNPVTLDRGQGGRHITTASNTKLALNNINFINGQTKPSSKIEDGSGAAIFRGWKGELHVFNAKFENNKAQLNNNTKDGGGGAIYTKSGGINVFHNVEFNQNQASIGGALYSLLSDLTIVDSKFTNNTATSSLFGYGGGAIQTDGGISTEADGSDIGSRGKLSICGSVFKDNTSNSTGGAGFFYIWGQDKLNIKLSHFENNKSKRSGGAIRLNGNIELTQSSFVNNTSEAVGGAMHIHGETTISPKNQTKIDPTIKVENITVFKNKSATDGGGIMLTKSTKAVFRNITVANNQSNIGGGVQMPDTTTVQNSIFANNTVVEHNGRNPFAENCNTAFKGSGNIEFPAPKKFAPACGNNTLQEDPKLSSEVKFSNGVAYLALQEGSSAIKSSENCIEKDILNSDRKQCDAGSVNFNQ